MQWPGASGGRMAPCSLWAKGFFRTMGHCHARAKEERSRPLRMHYVHCTAGAGCYTVPGAKDICEGMIRERGLSAEKPEQSGYGLVLQVELNLSLVLLERGTASPLLPLPATCYLLSPCASSDSRLLAQ